MIRRPAVYLLLCVLVGAPAGRAGALPGTIPSPQNPPVGQEDPLRFARSLFQDGLYDLAVDDLLKKLQAPGLTPQQTEDARWLLAEALEASEEIPRAAAAYREFASRHSTVARAPQAWLKAGDLFTAAGDPASAAAAYNDFLTLYPTSDRLPEAEAGLIRALLDQRKSSEALSRIRRARLAYQFNVLGPRFQLQEAEALHQMGDPDQALVLATEVLQRAESEDLRAETVALRVLLLLETGEAAAAIPGIRTALEASPPSPWDVRLRGLLGRALVEIGSPGEALEDLRTWAAGVPARGEALAWLGRAHAGIGEADSALANWEDALRYLDGDRAASVALEAAHLALDAGQAQQALQLADRAAAEAATPGVRRRALARSVDALRRLGRPGEVIDRYREVLEDATRPPEERASAAFGIGAVLEEDLTDPERAGGYYRQAAALAGSGPMWGEALWSSARTLAAREQFASAISELQPVADRSGDWGGRASEQIVYWRSYRLVDLAAGLQAIQRAVMAVATGGEEGRTDAVLELARTNARATKDFHSAVEAYDLFLEMVTGGERAATAHLEKGRSLEALGVIADHEERRGAGDPYRERAADAYAESVRLGGRSPVAEEAQLTAIALDLQSLRDQPVLYFQAMRDRYRAFLDTFTDSRRLHEVVLRIGQANEGLGEHGDPSYYEEAASAYRTLLEDSKPVAVRTQAEAGMGRSLYHLGQFGEAVPFLEATLQHPPAGVRLDELLFMAGDAALRAGNRDAAVTRFQELESRYPGSVWTARSSEATGNLYMAQGRPSAALASFRRFAQSAGPTDAGRALFKFAAVQYETGLPQQAMDTARRAASDSLVTPEWRDRALFLWGKIADETGQTAQALEAWRTLWEVAPLSDEAWEIATRYGEVLSVNGEGEAAERVWGVVVERATSDSLRARAQAELVYLAYAQQKIQAGAQRKQDFEQTWQRNRTVLDRYAPLFLAVEGQVRMQRSEWKEATDLFTEIIRRHTGSRYVAGALLGLGQAALQQEELEEAAHRFEEVVEQFPQSPEANQARFQLGQRAYFAADYDTAVRMYRSVAASSERQLANAAQYNLVQTLHQMRQWDAAQQEALTYLDKYPGAEDLFDMKMRLGQLYREGGQLGRARDWFRSLTTSDGEQQARLRFQTAETLFALGDYQEAVVEYLQVAILNEDQFLFAVTARLQAADSYALMGQKERALGLYKDIIQKHGADSDYGKVAREHMTNVEAGRSPRALPPPATPPPASRLPLD